MDDGSSEKFSLTGSSTPLFSTPPSTLSISTRLLKLGALHYPLRIPETDYELASELHEGFLGESIVEESIDGNDGHPELALLADFLAFASRKHEEKPVGKQKGLANILDTLLDELDEKYLHGRDIHSVVSKMHMDPKARISILSSYYKAVALTNRDLKLEPSALLSHGKEGKAKIYAVFGGQGVAETYLDELQELHETYKDFFEDTLRILSRVLQSLASNLEVETLYSKGLDVERWVREPQKKPDAAYLTSAPVSMPLIGLTQLMHYTTACRILEVTPGQFRDCLQGVTGHSQGIVTAIAISRSDTWPSFEAAASEALTILFWNGVRSQQSFPVNSLPDHVLLDCSEHDEQAPGPMLRITGLLLPAVQAQVAEINLHLTLEEHVHVSLINGPRNIIVTGPPMSLYGLNLKIRKLKSSKNLEQSRLPFSKRAPHCLAQFLPITAPFHSPLLASTTQVVVADLERFRITPADLAVPVYHTKTGEDLKSMEDGAQNLIPELIKMINEYPVHWEAATAFQDATHIIDFGTGGTSGVGILTQRNKEGTGVVSLLSGVVGGSSSDFGGKEELFDRDPINGVRYAKGWYEAFRPRLATAGGRVMVDTKMSRLLGLPPVMVGGMTPTTASRDFVAATINAGYHIELAAGGYHNSAGLGEALREIAKNIPSGRGITLNLIYLDPRAINWQIPLVQSLIAEGFPIEGLTIGAGIPSPDIAHTWITTLGLNHIAFKPGSALAIRDVLAIAKANPTFPFILQWTGGRGGGHHSYEDFHQPILETYQDIRNRDNVVLVAGSGFGGSDDSYEYLSGSWSLRYGRPPMPFDGVLFGSRVMTAREARTSLEAKQAIVLANGVEDHQWEETYRGPAGGVITVKSEMGAPIHKLATRGVRLWAELDKNIFSLEKSKQVLKLAEVRDYIIQRLNDDSHRIWFGKTASNTAADVQDMTYQEVAERLIQLMYLPHFWIDPSWRTITYDFLQRVEGRFVGARKEKDLRLSILQNASDLDDDPLEVANKIFAEYPESKFLALETEDFHYLLMICRRPKQKPVPFILTLDETFEMSFKKDSLWQSENVHAVFGQDIGRTCILQGPVAVKHSRVVDEPIKKILDDVHNAYVARLTETLFAGDTKQIPYFESSSISPVTEDFSNQTLTTYGNEDGLMCYHSTLSTTSPMNISRWFDVLGGEISSWRRSIFTTKFIIRGTSIQPNPVRDIFRPVTGFKVEIVSSRDPCTVRLNAYEQSTLNDEFVLVAQVCSSNGSEIYLRLFESGTGRSCALELQFLYDGNSLRFPIHEIMEGRKDRIKQFYQSLWFGDSSSVEKVTSHSMVVRNPAIKRFAHAVGNTNDLSQKRLGAKLNAPMDFAMVVCWEAIMKCLLSEKTADCDFLRLVHLSNSFTKLEDTPCYSVTEDDEITSTAEITAIINQDSGKMVQITGILVRKGQPIVEVCSKFLFRGVYTDFENNFEAKTETPFEVHLTSAEDVAVLQSRMCFHLFDQQTKLLGLKLTFKMHSIYRFQDKTTFSSIHTTGDVWLKISNAEMQKIGWVDCPSGVSLSNPVMEFLERKGLPTEPRVMFENAVRLNSKSPTAFKTPESNQAYALASSDYNPIHVSRIFAQYAGLPGPITHGMFTSASVRTILEAVVSNNDLRRMKSWNCKFVGMAQPNDQIQVELLHVGMVSGRKIIRVKALKSYGGQVVLTGEAEVEQSPTAYIFTGQGSQFQGMGMDLYATSAAARAVWDETDKFFIDNYGFALTHIIRENPRELTIHFGGAVGERIRRNYMAMEFEHIQPNGTTQVEKIFKGVDENSSSYTYISPEGLLSATQFTQAALVFMEKAHFEDMKANGLIQERSTFAGHSLGEYSALTALAEVIPADSLASIVFYRGLIMQSTVERDAEGRSNYGMCAVNPSRVSKGTYTPENIVIYLRRWKEN